MRQQDDAGLALGKARREIIRNRCLAPLVLETVDLAAVRLCDLRPAVAERAARDDANPLAGRAEVGDGRLHPAGAAGGVHEHLVLRAEDLLEPLEAALVDDPEVRPAMVNHRLRHRREHLRRHGRRPGREEIALSTHCLEPNGETGLRSPVWKRCLRSPLR